MQPTINAAPITAKQAINVLDNMADFGQVLALAKQQGYNKFFIGTTETVISTIREYNKLRDSVICPN